MISVLCRGRIDRGKPWKGIRERWISVKCHLNDQVEREVGVQEERGSLEIKGLRTTSRAFTSQVFENPASRNNPCIPVVAKLWHIHPPASSCWHPHGEGVTRDSLHSAEAKFFHYFLIKPPSSISGAHDGSSSRHLHLDGKK